MEFKFKDKELKKILDNLTIIIDSREQANQHIIDFFNKKKHPYVIEKLDFGDYSCKLPKGSFEGQDRDIYFTRDFVIERKANIDELCGNLKEDAARLKKELAHLNKYNIKYLIYIEDLYFEEHLRNGEFRSQYDPKTLMNRLYKGVEGEYDTVIIPVDKRIMGSKIYNKFQSWVYALMKHKGFILQESEGEI
ncbi:ERCC4-type nuclease [Clostridium botulinum]|uniref:ERCC4 domain-containing protein n=1 Tax=Clostridium botulinum TaxID=1491 RepID=UPI000596CCE8|nr:ERCC4 domain-containing protein [Clostridium botulinum]KIL06933.1 ERCC4-type nuclease [Clostridium botulinum]MBY6935261.1 ERCC4 domain-containing protein [Clostridium botulinum]NFL82104.1 ERCC4-type nuclease [Clostridium botulinum]NFN12693.1 ERCC4-type nuclease [Clostridium botulinum]NFO37902.1 ERCC4-type nuclease [Clostridium botulinum]